MLVFSSCTPAGYQDHETEHVLSDHANFPRTLTLQGLAVDYPEGFDLLFTMREPEYLTVNGNRVLLMFVGRTDAEEAHVYQYFLPIGNSAVGRVWFGCTDEEYKADPVVYDGIIASMRVDGR